MTPIQGARLDFVSRLVLISVARPLFVMGVWLAGLLASGLIAAGLEVDTATSSFLDRSSSRWADYQRSIDLFGGDEFLSLVIYGERRFDAATLEDVSVLSEKLAHLPGVRRVDSITTWPAIRREPDGSLHVGPVTEGAYARNPEMGVRGDRFVPRTLISADGRGFAANLVLDGDIDGDRAALVKNVERLSANHDVRISGVPLFRTRVNERTRSELSFLVPCSLVLIGILIGLAFGSFRAVLISGLCSVSGVVVAVAAMVLLGIPMSLSTMMLPPVLLGIGSAYTMHLLSVGEPDGSFPEFSQGLVEVSYPLALSGATTALGFVAMAAIPVDAIWQLGVIGGIGTLAVMVGSLSLGPALMVLMNMRGGRIHGRLGAVSVLWARTVVENRKSILVAWAIAMVLFGWGTAVLEVDTDIIRWFPHGDPVRDDYETIRSDFSGISPMNVVIESRGDEPVTSPRVLAAVEGMATYLQDRSDVGRVFSVVDPLRQLNEAFVGEDRLPEKRDLIEQYVLVLGSIGQFGDLISVDRRVANVAMRVDVNGSQLLLEIADDVERWWASNGARGFDAIVTGVMYEFARAEEAIAVGLLHGLTVAVFAIWVVLLGALGSLRFALVATVPNTFPIIVSYGFAGLLGVTLDAATICVGVVALGLAVDDTVHIACGYRARREEGFSPNDAIDLSVSRTMPVLILTTVAVSLGFATLGVSSFGLVGGFGLMTAAIAVLCLVADFTLLPVLLPWADGRKGAT